MNDKEFTEADLYYHEKCPECGEIGCYFPNRVKLKQCPSCGSVKDGKIVKKEYLKFPDFPHLPTTL